jgi:hypothetical protein
MAEHRETHQVHQEHQPDEGWLAGFVFRISGDNFIVGDQPKQSRMRTALERQTENKNFRAQIEPNMEDKTLVASFTVHDHDGYRAAARSMQLFWDGMQALNLLDKVDMQAMRVGQVEDLPRVPGDRWEYMIDVTEEYKVLDSDRARLASGNFEPQDFHATSNS